MKIYKTYENGWKQIGQPKKKYVYVDMGGKAITAFFRADLNKSTWQKIHSEYFNNQNAITSVYGVTY